jgi:acyl-CoA thioesterase I
MVFRSVRAFTQRWQVLPALLATIWLATSAHAATEPKILILGDSLSAAYNLNPDQGWPTLLEQQLDQKCAGVQLVNASIPGETTIGGKRRLPALLKQHAFRTVVIALGANDGLRGLPIAQLKANLEAMASSAEQAGARVVIIGMRLPPNFGNRYTANFAAAFADVAKSRKRRSLVPFMLEPIATDLNQFQADRIHPTAAAQPILEQHLRPTIQGTLVGCR